MSNESRKELAKAIQKALGDVSGIYDTSEVEDRQLADAIIAAGYTKPDLTNTARRERAQDAVLAFIGTPRRELFEYPHRDDESRELIAQADRVVVAVLDAMLSEPSA